MDTHFLFVGKITCYEVVDIWYKQLFFVFI